MIRAHNKAFVDALKAVPGLTNAVFTGRAPDVAPPPLYVVVYGDTGTPDGYTMGALPAARRWTVSTLYVGTSENEAWWVAEKVETAMLGRRLTVAGRLCTPLRRQASRPVAVDPDDETVFSGTDVWTFASTAAAA